MTSVKDHLAKMNAVRRSQGKAIRQDSSHFHSELTICSDRLCRESCDSLSSSGLSVTAWTFSLTSLLFISMWSIPPYEMQKADGSKNKHWKLLKSGTSTQQNGKISKVMIIGVMKCFRFCLLRDEKSYVQCQSWAVLIHKYYVWDKHTYKPTIHILLKRLN